MANAARPLDAWLLAFVLAAFFVLAPGSGVARSAVGGGHGGGHGGGFAGGGHRGEGSSRGREFGGGRFGGRPFPHEHEHRGPDVFVFPYFYDPYYGYDPYYPYYPGYPYAPSCDPYSPSYAPQYCYWDGP